MARFTRTATITVNDTVTAATLHNLIESCGVADLSGADVTIGQGIYFSSVTTATPNASISPFWYDPSDEDPIFRVFAAPWNCWLAIGPDRFEIPLLNSAATLALKGALIVAAPGASSFTMASNPSLNAIGFAQAPIPAGAYGPVATCGIGWGLYCSAATGGTLPDASYSAISRHCPMGTCAALSIENDTGNGPHFGMWLETDRSGFSGSYSTKRTFIWGPRLTSGF